MKIGDTCVVSGWGYMNKYFNNTEGRIYDLAEEGVNRPITVEFEDGYIDCFTVQQITMK